MSKYSEKFKDPRWQRKRLFVLERDNWTCQYCGDKETTLHIHHLWYEKGKEPWEYPDECFLTLCEDCHHEEYELRRQEEQSLLTELKKLKLSAADVSNLMIGLHFIDEYIPAKEFIDIINHLSDFPKKLEKVVAICQRKKRGKSDKMVKDE